MIWVIGNVDGNYYKEPFSKGILARSLRISRIGLDEAYEIASDIENNLIKEGLTEISVNDLKNYIADYLNNFDENISSKYRRWRNIRKSNDPLIILIGGASGVGTSSMAFEIANRLGLKNIISTDMIREVMRKIVSKELNPVIHKSSFDAYESIRTHSIRVNAVIEGFISHADVVNVGVEAIIERSIKEGISIIIEGVHIVPGFIRNDLMKKDNVLMFILTVNDEEMHKQRFYARCRQPWVKRSIDHYMDNFETIRQTQDFLIDQAKIHNTNIIDNVDIRLTLDTMVDSIIDYFGNVKYGVDDVHAKGSQHND